EINHVPGKGHFGAGGRLGPGGAGPASRIEAGEEKRKRREAPLAREFTRPCPSGRAVNIREVSRRWARGRRSLAPSVRSASVLLSTPSTTGEEPACPSADAGTARAGR